ncbi:hypothetical protein H2O64_06215 [Kordia sp. YSTF-M3]|uniref:Uncharacterized protein n=1 Tax=Kordia aestuariivivens TaxID=2759037 RepID=A0ABR7Q6R1_9FLAO|nr:hypothetical protein [Kordia aestuariivivens]MBC8754259.1 hypothetical protein [Kordia aestuariivivens]
MQAIPVKVKNVTVYAYFNPIEPLEEVIITGATGTYSVGTLMTNIFYNLDLNADGKRHNPLNVHGKYYATGETSDGTKFTTPWMYCLENDATPTFGRTVSMLHSKHDIQNATINSAEADPSDYITLGPLTDITVSQLFPAPEIGQLLLIENGKGNIIGTRIGTPHLMGVQVDSGDRVGRLVGGMKNIIITAKTKDGKPFSQIGLTTISAGKPAIFLRLFP